MLPCKCVTHLPVTNAHQVPRLRCINLLCIGRLVSKADKVMYTMHIFVGNNCSFKLRTPELIWTLNHRWAHMAFTTLVIIMFNQLLGGECYHANVSPICWSLMHTSIRPWCLGWGVLTFSALADWFPKLTKSCTPCTFFVGNFYQLVSNKWASTSVLADPGLRPVRPPKRPNSFIFTY